MEGRRWPTRMQPDPVRNSTDTANSRAEEVPPREEPGAATHPDSADEQEQGGPRGPNEMTFLQRTEEAWTNTRCCVEFAPSEPGVPEPSHAQPSNELGLEQT